MPQKSKDKARVTQEQIARELGLSRSIVTQALQGTRSSRVSPETRDAVRAMAARIGYRPVNVTTHAIGCLMTPGYLLNQADVPFIVALEALVREHGYRLTIVDSTPAAGAAGQFPLERALNAKTVDGLILMTWSGGRFRHLISRSVPAVLASEEEDADIDVDQVGLDLPATFANVFGFLHRLDHRQVELVNGSATDPFFTRVSRDATAAAQGLPDFSLGITNTLPQPTASLVLARLRRQPRPTALVFADPERAMLTYCGLLEAGCRIPDDISLLCLFDAPIFKRLETPMAATSAAGYGMAQRVVKRLLEKIETPERTPQRIMVAGDVIERASVAMRASVGMRASGTTRAAVGARAAAVRTTSTRKRKTS